jgi:hypothetical protein
VHSGTQGRQLPVFESRLISAGFSFTQDSAGRLQEDNGGGPRPPIVVTTPLGQPDKTTAELTRQELLAGIIAAIREEGGIRALHGIKVKIVHSLANEASATEFKRILETAGAFVDTEQRLTGQIESGAKIGYVSSRRPQAELMRDLLAPVLSEVRLDLVGSVGQHDLEFSLGVPH